MASKFQNRMVGTIILAILGIIIFFGLLVGKKKYYQDEFTAIPLVPKPGDSDKFHVMLPASSNSSCQQETLMLPKMNTMVSAPVKPELKSVSHPENSLIPLKSQMPKEQMWVVQLGALKNINKVSEIVGILQLSGYRVYTLPSVPVQGEITRIFIGPDVSKKALQSALGELYQLSGLNGQLRPYNVR